MSEPASYQPPVSVPRTYPHNSGHRRGWVLGIVSTFVAAVIVIAVVALMDDGDGTSSSTEQTAPAPLQSAQAPQPISRAALMAEYARIAPLDRTATPDTVDDLAQSTCGLLRSGSTTDRLISVANEQYGANATRVVQLLVSYKCPEFLKDFK